MITTWIPTPIQNFVTIPQYISCLHMHEKLRTRIFFQICVYATVHCQGPLTIFYLNSSYNAAPRKYVPFQG